MTRFAALALLCALFAVACKPPPADLDAGCVPATTTKPSDSGTPSCQPWSQGCQSEIDLAVQAQFTQASVCQVDSDCALYGGQLQYGCYVQYFTPPINAAQRASLDLAVDGILCGFCESCYSDGGIYQTGVSPPEDAGCTELQCINGHCQPITF